MRYDLHDGVQCEVENDCGVWLWWLIARVFYNGMAMEVCSDEFVAASPDDALIQARDYCAEFLAQFSADGFEVGL